MKYTLISSIVYFDTKSKIHICKENGTVNALCGKQLGFNYEPHRLTDCGELEQFTKNQLNNMLSICKICLNKINNDKNTSGNI
jgi:hypothetical protein